MHVAEEIREPLIRITHNEQEISINEFPKLLYMATSGDTKLRVVKEEKEIQPNLDRKLEQAEKGLPPQPTGYLKYPNHDLL